MNRLRLASLSRALTLVACCAAAGSVAEAEPRRDALHSAEITALAADPGGRFLVTGSADKTVRVWDRPTGRALGQITPPGGEGREGEIYAVAISPDGKTIACGGYTGHRSNQEQGGKSYYDIYVYERESARLLHKLPVPYVIEGLAYSSDGAWLVSSSLHPFDAQSAGDFGSDRVFDTRDYRWEREAFPRSGAAGTLAAFGGQGRLVLAQKFGMWLVSLVGRDATESRQISGIPTSVSFSPDGARIAIAFADSTVGVYSGDDLSLLYPPDVKTIGPGDTEFTEEDDLAPASLSAVTWSLDGASLYYTGGRTCGTGSCFIRRWAGAGRGAFQDLPAATERITRLAALPGGALAFATDLAFGVLDAEGRRTFLVTGEASRAAEPSPEESDAPDEEPAKERGCIEVRPGSLEVTYQPGRWGFIDKTGAFAIPPRFPAADSFSDGLARVTIDGRLGFIDRSGQIVIEPTFEPPIGRFREGRAAAWKEDRWGFIDGTGRMVIPPQFSKVFDFSDGLALVGVPEQRAYGFIDRNGRLVIRPRFGEARPFSEGLAAVQLEAHWGYIDKTGKTLIEPRFDAAWPFAEGFARVREPCPGGCDEGYIDETGKTIIRGVRPTNDGSFAGSRAMIFDREYRVGFIDTTGKIVVDPTFSGARSFAEERAAVEQKGQWGFIDQRGELVVPPQFDEADNFSEGLAAVQRDGKWGYLARDGTLAIEPKFDNALAFSESLAAVCVGAEALARLPQSRAATATPTPAPEAPTAVVEEPPLPLPSLDSSETEELAALHREVGELERGRSYLQALPHARRAMDIVEESLDPGDPRAVEPMVDLARVSMALGEYRRGAGEGTSVIQESKDASSLYARALAIRERDPSARPSDLAELLDELGALLGRMGKFDEAADVLQRGLELRSSTLGADHPETLASKSELTAVRVRKLSASQRSVEAFSLAQTALRDAEQSLGPDHPSVGRALVNLADLLRSMRASHIDASLALYERALAIFERSFGPDHWSVAQLLGRLGEAYVAKGDRPRADQTYARMLSIEEKILGADHPVLAELIERLGRLDRSLARFDDAERLLRRALAMREKERQGYRIGRALEDLGALYRAMGKPAQAEPYYVRALAIREQWQGPNHYKTAESLRSLGTVYRVMGDPTRAEPLVRRALAIHQADGGDLALPWAVRDLAALESMQHDYRSALRLLMESLAAQEQEFDGYFLRQREEDQLAYLQSRYVVGSYFFLLSLVANHMETDPEAVETAMELVARRKGIVFDVQADARVRRAQLSPAAQAKWDQLRSVRNELATLLLRRPRALDRQAYENRLIHLFAQKSALERALELSTQPARRPADKTVTRAALAAALPERVALVQFVKIPEFDYAREDFDFPTQEWNTSSRYLAFVLTSSGEVSLHELGPAKPVEDAAGLVSRDMHDSGATAWNRSLKDLYARLWAPLAPSLASADGIIISPDGALNLVPFAALMASDGTFLLERHRLAYVNTARELLATRDRRRDPASDLLLVSSPAFDAVPGEPAAGDSVLRSRDFRQRFEPLQGTDQEAAEIPPLVPGVRGRSVLVGAKATEGAVKRATSPRILHLATHGFFLPDQPLRMDQALLENSLVRSGLAFAGANRAVQYADGEDGLLTALEVTGMDLSGTDLVVLSACDTGVGDVRMGEGVFGLRRAFALAGAKNVMMSLWPVSDAVTAMQMKYFYQALPELAPADALRRAQLQSILELKARDGEAHPWRWAPFILEGGHAFRVLAD